MLSEIHGKTLHTIIWYVYDQKIDGIEKTDYYSSVYYLKNYFFQHSPFNINRTERWQIFNAKSIDLYGPCLKNRNFFAQSVFGYSIKFNFYLGKWFYYKYTNSK